MQGVLHRVPLPQELGIPCHLDGVPNGRQLTRPSAQPRGRAHRHRRLAEYHRRCGQQRGQRFDHSIDIFQIRRELALLLRRCDRNEVHVRKLGGLLV